MLQARVTQDGSAADSAVENTSARITSSIGDCADDGRHHHRIATKGKSEGGMLPPLAGDLQLAGPDASMAGLQLRFNLHDFSSNDGCLSSPHPTHTRLPVASDLHDALLKVMTAKLLCGNFAQQPAMHPLCAFPQGSQTH
jgi:hypothetical protein